METESREPGIMLSCKALNTVTQGEHSINVSWYYYYRTLLTLRCTFKVFLEYFKSVPDNMSFHLKIHLEIDFLKILITHGKFLIVSIFQFS